MRPLYRTGVPLPSKCCILYIFSTDIITEYFKHAAHSPFSSSKCRLFHNATFFGSCIIHILHIGCAKILNVKFKVYKSVHHRRIQKNHQPDAFSVYYPDVCLQLNMFRAFSRSSSGAQWLQWQPLVLPSYRGDSSAVFVVGPAGPTTNNSTATTTFIR